jgi:hypothetical protein
VVPVIGVVTRPTADGKYAPGENGQDALMFIVVFGVLLAVLYVASRRKR